MTILIDEATRVVVQGMTGREGRLRTGLMMDYGTKVLAGVTPGREGEKFRDVPVYDTVKAAVERHPAINTSLILVPASLAKDAAFEAIEAGIAIISLMPERLPHQDMLEIIAFSRARGSMVIGPNSPGLLSPGKAMVGGLGGQLDMARTAFTQGPVGIISRSGGNTMTLAYYLTKAGLGQSTAVGVGGDGFVGTSWRTILERFAADAETQAVVAYGEIGGNNEEEAAEFLQAGGFKKPLIVYIGGRFAREGMRFGHAGAVFAQGRGTAEDKRRRLRDAGAIVVDHMSEIAPATKAALSGEKP